MHTIEPVRVPWKRTIFAVSETVLTFTIASFLLGLMILHHDQFGIAAFIFAGITYAAAVITTVYRMVRKFSLAANMLMVPIAPLVILIIIVSLIHLLQYFR